VQDGSVAWDPIVVDRQLPWQDKLFILYLLVVLGMAIIRSVGMARQLWFGGPLSKNDKHASTQFLYIWDLCAARAAGIKRMAVLTLLLALVMLTHGVTSILVGIAQEKRVWPGAVAGGLAEVVGLVTLGTLVSALLYGFAISYQGVLSRRRVLWSHSRSNDDPS